MLLKEDDHHPSLEIVLNFVNVADTKYLSNSSYNFKKANFQGLYELLFNSDWSFLVNCNNVETACSLFYDKLNNIFSMSVPKNCRFKKRRYPPWFGSEIVHKLKVKWKLWVRYKRSKNVECYNDFKILRAEIKQEIKLSYLVYIHNIENKIHSYPNFFWQLYATLKKRILFQE